MNSYQHLLVEWDYERNAPLTPDNVSWASARVVGWKCPTCDYRWQASVGQRTRRPYIGCIHCNNYARPLELKKRWLSIDSCLRQFQKDHDDGLTRIQSVKHSQGAWSSYWRFNGYASTPDVDAIWPRLRIDDPIGKEKEADALYLLGEPKPVQGSPVGNWLSKTCNPNLSSYRPEVAVKYQGWLSPKLRGTTSKKQELLTLAATGAPRPSRPRSLAQAFYRATSTSERKDGGYDPEFHAQILALAPGWFAPENANYNRRVNNQKRSRPVIDQYGIAYKSIQEAADKIKCVSSGISQVLSGKNKSIKGYIFRYLETES